MLAGVLSLLMFLTPLGQQRGAELRYEIRAGENRMMGKGQASGAPYYDVVVTRQPTSGILIKLDYTRSDATFSFDLHHRVSLGPDFVYPAELITTVEVLSGGTSSIGTYTIIDTIKSGDAFPEAIDRISKADVDRYTTPFGRKTIKMKMGSGSQSISIVGQSVTVTRGTRTTTINTPGQRVAIVSNFKFLENRPGTLLSID